MSSLLRKSKGLTYNADTDENIYITDDLRGKQAKEEVLPYLQNRPNFISENDSQKSQLSNFLQQVNSVDVLNAAQTSTENHARPKKRRFPKAGPKCSKKKALDSYFVEENSLDGELLGLAESIDIDKNIDSDSSTDTIIIEDTIIIDDSNSSINAQHVTHVDNTNTFSERTPNNKIVEVSDGFSVTRSSSVENGRPVNNLHLTSVKKEAKDTRSNTAEPKSAASLLREVLTTAPSSRVSSLPAVLTTHVPSLNSLKTESTVFESQTKLTKSKKAAHKDLEKEMGIQNANLFSSNSCQNNKASSHQSVYASMGLDEDLCDTQPSSSVILSSISKEGGKLQTENRPNIQIKTEIDDSTFVDCKSVKKVNHRKNERLTSDGLHVSMTFEAESSCEDIDDGEDDLPLLLLKNKKVDNSSPKIKSDHVNSETKLKTSTVDASDADNVLDFNPDPSFFIKKELIEDEIVSESQAVSAKTLPQSSDAHDNLLPVKIKPEPIDYEYSEFNIENSPLSDTNSIQKQMHGAAGLSTNIPKGKKKKSIPKPSKANYSPAKSPNFVSNSEFEGEKGKNDTRVLASEINIFSSQVNDQNYLFKSNIPDQSPEVNKISINESSPSDSSSSKEKSNKTTKSNKKAKPNIVVDKTVLDRYDKTISDVIAFSLSETVHQDLQTTEDNIMDSNTSVNDLNILDSSTSVTESNIKDSNTSSTQSENELTPNKRKRKKTTKKTLIDENVPITLLIKKQKTDSNDANAPDSFLCTSVASKTSTKDLPLPSNLQENETELLEKGTDNSSIPSETSVVKKAPKNRKGKKKQTKKKNQKKTNVSTVSNDTLQSEINDQPPFNNVNTHSDAFESTKNDYQVDNYLSESVLSSPQKPDTNERHDNLTFVPPVQKDKFLSNVQSIQDSPDLQESISAASSQASYLEDMSSRSEVSNFGSIPDLDVNVPKKKKRRARSNNWYKKKKSRVKSNKGQVLENMLDTSIDYTTEEASSSYQTPEKMNSPNNACENINSLIKQPIVIINKVPSDIHVNAQNNENVVNTTSSELTQAAKKGKKKPKRKGKKSTKSKNSSLNKQSSLKDSIEPETSEVVDNCLQNDQQAPTANNSKNATGVAAAANESDIDRFCREALSTLEQDVGGDNASKDISDGSSLTVGERESLFLPSLNVQEIAKEIATFEAIIENRISESSSSGSQNIPRSHSENVALQNRSISMPQTSTVDGNRNSLASSFLSTQSTSLLSNTSGSAQLLSDVQIKKELIDNFCESSVNQPKQMTLASSEKESLGNNTKSPEMNSADKSPVMQSFIATNQQIPILNSGTQVNKNLTNVSTSTPPCSIPQSSQNVDINTIGLSIKKEVCGTAKSTSCNNYTIKDQNDLIGVAQKLNSRTSTVFSNSPFLTTSEKASLPQTSSLGSSADDEIEVLPVENSEKNILCLDLTDENNQSDSVCNTQQKASEYNKIASISGDVIEWSKRIKTENTEPKSNCDNLLNKPITQTSVPEQPSSTFSFPRCDISGNQLDLSKIKTNVSTSGFIKDGDTLNNIDPTKRETGNAYIVRDKYIDEYFKHPFPPSLVLHNKKQRNRNKMYRRIDSNTWNLPLEEVQFRLKQSEVVMPQFGKKLGDIVKLEKYTVSLCEAECYHRILGVAPSQKLISKCFLSPNKKMNTIINSEFNKPYQQELNEAKDINQMNCTIDDILQGITETKMMYSSNISDNDSILLDQNCASVDTTDSFDSCVSSLTDKMLGVASNNDIQNSRLFPAKTNELDSTAKVPVSDPNSFLTSAMSDTRDALKNSISNVSIVQNSLLSSTTSHTEDSLENVDSIAVSNIKQTDSSFSSNLDSHESVSYMQNNVLSGLRLPNQETINNILSISEASHSTSINASNVTSTSQTACVDTPVTSNYLPSQTNYVTTSVTASTSVTEPISTPVTIKPSLTPENFVPVETDLVPKVDATESRSSLNQSLGVLDLPVTELRKILEAAGSLHSNNADTDGSGMWKNKATFEYNHTQSTPVTDKNSEQNMHAKDAPSLASEQTENIAQEKEDGDSDDGYVDTEPLPYESENERDDSSSHEKDEEPEPAPIPQYKSKWEKIMERKSQEMNEKQGVNELFLKDCIPVSSRLKSQSKKINTLNKEPPLPDDKVTSKSSEEKAKGKPKKKLKGAKSKLSKSKNEVETSAEKKTKSDKTPKKAGKEDAKNNESKNSKKELPTKKAKDKVAEDVSDLFVPDKLVKTPTVKKPSVKKPSPQTSEENSKSKRFYGNRITNRGSFLTETNPSKLKVNMPKIPKKKTSESTNKSNVRSEEFHSMIKSPDISINSSYRSYKSGNKPDSRKNTEYKSPLSNTSQHATSHFIRTKRMRDRQLSYSHPHHFDRNNEYKQRNAPYYDQYASHSSMPNKKGPLLETPLSEEGMLNRKRASFDTPPNNEFMLNTKGAPLLATPPSNEFMLNTKGAPLLATPSQNDDGLLNRQNSLFENVSSLSSHCFNNESTVSQNIPVIIGRQTSVPSKPPPDSLQSNPDPQLSLLKQIISAFQTNPNPVPEVKDSLNALPTGISSNWSGSQFGSSYNVNDPSFKQNLNHLTSLSADPRNPSNNPFRNTSVPGSLDPRRAALGLQSNINMPVNSALGLPSNINVPVNSVFGNVPASETLDPRLTSLSLHSASKSKLDSPSGSSPLIFSPPPPCATSVNPPASQSSRKATCLVPQHLKSQVGHKTIETDSVRLLMLEWSVDWLNQQQHSKDPPPICNTLKKVVSSYDNFEDYYNTYFPLMLLETWQRIYVSWMHLNQTVPYSCQITSYSVKNHYVSVECQTVFSTDVRPKGVFPDEGSILLIKYCTKSNDYAIKIFGYVTHVKTRRFNPVTDSKICSSLVQKDANPDCLQILTLTFMGAYNSEDIDKRQPVRIHVLCTVKHTLKQNDALLYINKSPLQRSILHPVADGLLTFTLTSRNSAEDKVNECVRDITKGILSPHPLPLLTVVRATPESDRLNIIPLLIQKMKSAYRTKVLLCVRTVRALGDIAANICLQPSLKLVIINKRCDTNPQFQKFLLDELVSSEIKKVEDDKSVDKANFKHETGNKIKKQILKDCDVVLSLVRNSHDDFMCETFIETESIAQMCCIVDEANLCTEPETLIPILHGISKLILIGDPDYNAKVLSKTAMSYDYNQSFFQRAYDLDLLTE